MDVGMTITREQRVKNKLATKISFDVVAAPGLSSRAEMWRPMDDLFQGNRA